MRRFLIALVLFALAFAGAGNRVANKGSGTWDPQIPALGNWYDSPLIGLSSGAPVTSFPDSKTGNPNPLFPPGSLTYVTPGQNSLGVVQLDGTKYLSTGGSSATTYPRTFAAVVKVASYGGHYCIIGPSTNGGLEFRIDQTTGYLTFNSANTAAIGTSTTAVGTGAYHLVVGVVTSTTYAFYIDGVAAGSGTHSISLTGGGTLQMGTFAAGSDLFVGFLGELQIYFAALTAGDVGNMWNTFIKPKWGL